MISKVFDKKEKGNRRQIEGDPLTICEVTRRLYDLLVTELSENHMELLKKCVPLLEKAHIMGAKMALRLIDHKLYDVESHECPPDKKKEKEMGEWLREERLKLIHKLKHIENPND